LDDAPQPRHAERVSENEEWYADQIACMHADVTPEGEGTRHVDRSRLRQAERRERKPCCRGGEQRQTATRELHRRSHITSVCADRLEQNVGSEREDRPGLTGLIVSEERA